MCGWYGIRSYGSGSNPGNHCRLGMVVFGNKTPPHRMILLRTEHDRSCGFLEHSL